MTSTDWVTLIGILLAFIGSSIGHVATTRNANKALIQTLKEQSTAADAEHDKRLAVYAASTDAKIEALSQEIREHNQFAKRVPILETKMEMVERKLERRE